MDGKQQKVSKRKVIKLNAITLDKSNHKYLSLHECEMKDIRQGDTFIMLESSLELVIGKENKFIWRAKSNALPHKESFVVQAEEL